MARIAVMALAFVAALGCSESRDVSVDGSTPVDGPDGAVGVCCPLETPSCNCFSTGGWAPNLESCGGICDLGPTDYEIDEDAYGCEQYRFVGSPRGCCGCPPDGGLFVPDASVSDATPGDAAPGDGGNDRPNPPSRRCPRTEPTIGSTCNTTVETCYYGQECCCGACFPSYGCTCIDGTWSCFYTDACFIPYCPDGGLDGNLAL